jgi:acyl transferase domain-containing protein
MSFSFTESMSEHERDGEHGEVPAGAVAIVGMAGRFPGADDLDAFWANLRAGVESVRTFTAEELRAAGTPEAWLADPSFVPRFGALSDVEGFDAAFFGYSPSNTRALAPRD